jgi:hypothetical protein
MRKHLSKKMDLNALLRSQKVLYVVFFFAVINLFGYLMWHQLDAVAFFIIIGLLTTYFSKNMIIVMFTAMLSTFFLVQIKMLGGNKEGLEGMEEEKEDTEEGMKDKKVKEGNEGIKDKKDEKPKPKPASASESDGSETEPAPEKKSKERFTQQLNPARYNSADDDDMPQHKPKVDYAATLESAYDNLDKLLSSDAIKNMSEDTNRLAEKQHKLMGNIEKLTPIMDKASSLLQNIDVGGISGLMSGIQDRMKGFSKDGAAGGKGVKGMMDNMPDISSLLKDSAPVKKKEGFQTGRW